MDDYAAALLRCENGAPGSMWVTNPAAGPEHGLSFRIHGDRGGLDWHQEEPNRLIHGWQDDLEQVLTRWLGPARSPAAQRSTRMTIGHPEGSWLGPARSPAAQRSTRMTIGHPEGFRVKFFQLLGGDASGDMVARPKSQLFIVPGATHVTMVFEKSSLLGKVVVDFLDEKTSRHGAHAGHGVDEDHASGRRAGPEATPGSARPPRSRSPSASPATAPAASPRPR